jgi:reactive intermediate/imine deaminase
MTRCARPGALCLLVLAALFPVHDSPAGESSSDVEFFTSPETEKLGLPFSDAVRVGSLLYASAIGNVPGTLSVVPGGIEAETKQTLENLRRVLERNGSSLDRVVKCTVMLTDMSEWSGMNAAYATFFAKPYPARTSFGVSGLSIGARVEIECIATVGARTR